MISDQVSRDRETGSPVGPAITVLITALVGVLVDQQPAAVDAGLDHVTGVGPALGWTGWTVVLVGR